MVRFRNSHYLGLLPSRHEGAQLHRRCSRKNVSTFESDEHLQALTRQALIQWIGWIARSRGPVAPESIMIIWERLSVPLWQVIDLAKLAPFLPRFIRFLYSWPQLRLENIRSTTLINITTTPRMI